MITNKDKGTSVGFSNDKKLGDLWPEFFSEKNFDKLPEFLKNNFMNKVCEHEFISAPIITEFCKFCAKEKIEIINKQEWEDIQKSYMNTDEYKYNTSNIGTFTHWLKENYLAPEKK